MEKCIGCELCAGVCPAKLHLRARRRQPPRRPGLARASASASSTRSTTCAASTATCASRPAPPRPSPSPSCSSSPSPTARTPSTPRTSCWSTTTACPSSCRGRTGGAGEDLTTPRPGCGPPPRRATPTTRAWSAWSGELGYGVRAPELGQSAAGATRRPEVDRRPRPTTTTTHGDAGTTDGDRRLPRQRGDRAGRRRWASSPSRNPVHTALSLVATLFGVAVLFVAQDAHFLAAVQVIVYAGAIVMLFLFVIMLLGVDQAEDLAIEPLAGQRPLAILAGAATLGLLLVVLLSVDDTGHRGRGRSPPAVSGDASPNVERARPGPVHRLRLRLRDHRRAAHHRRGRRRRAGPPSRRPAASWRPRTTRPEEVERDAAPSRSPPPGTSSSAAMLFTIGAVGLLVRRNPLVMFMCVELMLNAVNLTFVAFGRVLDDIGGQVVGVLRAGRGRGRGGGRPRRSSWPSSAAAPAPPPTTSRC